MIREAVKFIMPVVLFPPCSWVEPFFWVGCRHGLDQTDLYAHPDEAGSEKLLNTFNRYLTVVSDGGGIEIQIVTDSATGEQS